jgi:hypothetical protein
MAALTSQQVFNMAVDGNVDQCFFSGLRNVTSGDTLDAGPTGLGFLQNVHRAVCLFPLAGVTGDMAVSGTVVTIPAGLSGDDGYALIWGSGGV